jgi:hypothetical protein
MPGPYRDRAASTQSAAGSSPDAAPIPLRRIEPANGGIQFQNPIAERPFPLGYFIGGVPA